MSPYLLLTLTALFWSGNFVLARAVHAEIPPLALSFWRWLLALLILLPLAGPRLWRQWPIARAAWRPLLLLAAFGVAAFNSFVYLGLQHTTATNAVLLQSAIPVLIIALSWLFLGQRLAALQFLGLLVSLLGVGVIVFHGDLQRLQLLGFNRGDLLVMAAVISWAVYSVLLRYRPAELSALAFLLAIVALGVLLISPFYLWELAAGKGFALTLPNLLSVGYVGIFPSVLAYIFWNYGVDRVGASKAGLFIHLMPVFGILLSVVFLGERIRFFHFVGIVLIFLGIYWVQRARAKVPGLGDERSQATFRPENVNRD